MKLFHETHPITANITCKEIELDNVSENTVSSDQHYVPTASSKKFEGSIKNS
jgi:hypothetical protein